MNATITSKTRVIWFIWICAIWSLLPAFILEDVFSTFASIFSAFAFCLAMFLSCRLLYNLIEDESSDKSTDKK